MKNITSHVLVVLGLAALAGCSNTPSSQQEVSNIPDSAPPVVTGPMAQPLPEEKPNFRPIPIETLYALLVAEIAGSRERYDIALGNYIQEAQRTRDPGVTARATRIARLLNAHQAALGTGQLWIEIEPNNPEAIFIVASELAQAGRLTEAFSYSEQLQRMGSTPIFESIAARSGQVTDIQREQLLSQYSLLLKDYPKDIELLVGSALLLQQQGKPEEALAVTRQALEIDGEDIQAAVIEARLLYQLNRPEKALDRLLALLQKNPDNQRLRLQYARLLANIDLGEAKKQFEILVAQTPGDPDLLFSLGLIANEQRDIETAKRCFQQLLTLGSHTDSAHFYLGQIAQAEGDTERALQHFLLVSRGQDFLPAVTHAMDIYISDNRMEEADALMEKMRAAFPTNTEQFYLLEAQLLARYQHLDASEATLTEGLTLHPNNTDLLYTRAIVNEQRDMVELAESDLRTIIKYQPNNATALNALGYTLADRTTRFDEAYQLIQQALNISPDDPAIMDSMGWVQYRLGNYEEAVLRLREALKAFPDHEVAAHLGEVLWVSGETEQARAVWTEGLRLNPNSDIIPEVIQRLNAGSK